MRQSAELTTLRCEETTGRWYFGFYSEYIVFLVFYVVSFISLSWQLVINYTDNGNIQ